MYIYFTIDKINFYITYSKNEIFQRTLIIILTIVLKEHNKGLY